jgi:hypothetical protein
MDSLCVPGSIYRLAYPNYCNDVAVGQGITVEVAPDRICALCGHNMMLDQCGYATITMAAVVDQEIFLCHTDDHDCYHAWTIYGERP